MDSRQAISFESDEEFRIRVVKEYKKYKFNIPDYLHKASGDELDIWAKKVPGLLRQETDCSLLSRRVKDPTAVRYVWKSLQLGKKSATCGCVYK
jgi:hypothetical protein